MIKKVIFSMAAIALLTFSCTRSEVENQNFSAPSVISLNPNTASTRAAIMDLDSLKLDASGFVVYADTVGTANSDDWFIDGEDHVFGTGGWGFPSPILWPYSGYPVVFLAYYPKVSNVIDAVTPATVPFTTSSLELAIIVPPEKELQEDVLVARDTQKIAKPADGKLNIHFKHILSKVNFTFTTHDGTGQTSDPDHKTYVLAVGFGNLFSKNTYEATTDVWDALAIGDDTDDYDYYNSFVTLTGTDTYDEFEFVNADKDPIFTGADIDSAHLMLLPQTRDVWNIHGPIASPTGDEAYIRVLYRQQVSGDDDYIGYLDAHSHPLYPGSVLPSGYSEPLYVLVGYTFSSATAASGTVVWDPGKGYSYDIPLPGAGGGIYLSDYYYDNQGNETDLPIDGAIIGGHVLSIDNIILNPEVSPWDDDPPYAVEE